MDDHENEFDQRKMERTPLIVVVSRVETDNAMVKMDAVQQTYIDVRLTVLSAIGQNKQCHGLDKSRVTYLHRSPSDGAM